MRWFRRKKPTAEMAIYANPPTINPNHSEQRAFADWRAAHIERWLADPENAAQEAKAAYLKAEVAMYRAWLEATE